jgi:hypothetical protein
VQGTASGGRSSLQQLCPRHREHGPPARMATAQTRNRDVRSAVSPNARIDLHRARRRRRRGHGGSCADHTASGAPTTVAPVTTAAPATASTATAPDADQAGAYCTSKGGTVETRHPFLNTSLDRSSWVQLAGSLELCRFESHDADTSRLYVDTTSLAATSPTLADAAYLAKLPLPRATGGGNPAAINCVKNVDGASGWGTSANGAPGSTSTIPCSPWSTCACSPIVRRTRSSRRLPLADPPGPRRRDRDQDRRRQVRGHRWLRPQRDGGRRQHPLQRGRPIDRPAPWLHRGRRVRHQRSQDGDDHRRARRTDSRGTGPPGR